MNPKDLNPAQELYAPVGRMPRRRTPWRTEGLGSTSPKGQNCEPPRPSLELKPKGRYTGGPHRRPFGGRGDSRGREQRDCTWLAISPRGSKGLCWARMSAAACRDVLGL